MTYHPEDQLSAYIDDELLDEERQQVEEHVETCLSCQALMEDLIAMQHDVEGMFHSMKEPANLDMRVLMAIRKEEPAAARKGLLLIPIMALFILSAIWITTGNVIAKLAHGCFTLIVALVYMASHFISSVPFLSGLTVVLSLIILTTSIYSLKRLLQTTTI